MLPASGVFECGTRILRVIHGAGPHANSSNCTTAVLPSGARSINFVRPEKFLASGYGAE
jgi:hypothetical protein